MDTEVIITKLLAIEPRNNGERAAIKAAIDGLIERDEKIRKADEINDEQATIMYQLSQQLRAYEMLTRAPRL